MITDVLKYFEPEYPRQKLRFTVKFFVTIKISSDNIMRALGIGLKMSETDVDLGYTILDGLYTYYIDKYRGGQGGY
jgi:hypothetical protein